MDNPIKLIYKYKNLNKRIQYQLFVYVGFLISEDLKKLLIKIEKLNFFDTLMKISLKELQLLESSYGESWYFKLFVTENLRQSFNLIDRNSQKKKDIISKFGKAWFDKNINLDLFFEKSMYSHQYLYKKEKELREREKILREKNLLKDDDDDIDYSTRRNKQSGGNNDEIDEVDDLDGEEDEEDTEVIDSNLEFDDVDEFDMEELENMYKETEIDENLKSTSELIDKIMKSDEKNITSKDKLVDFPNDKDIETYDDNIKNLNTKIFIFDQFINYDDTIKKIKEKISCSIKLNNLYNKNGTVSHMPTLSPSRLYLWSQYKYNDREDRKIKTEQIMLGQKWIKRNELLKIDVEPNENLKIYEDLKGEFNNLKQDIKKYGSRIRREEDENNLLDKYNKYIDNNEIYVIDLFNELGMNYLSSQEKLKNLFDVYIKIYFFHISSDELKQIVNYLNLKEDKNRRFEIGYMRNVYQTLKNDLIMENEIVKTVESIDISSNKNIKNMFKDNYITHSVTHVYLGHSNTYNYPNLDLFRIFDNFIMTNDCPFVQYQTDDGKMNYKFYTALEEDDENAIRSKWFENSPYGISFKIKAEQKGGSYNKYISVSLNQNGRLTYKIQWKRRGYGNSRRY